ncbi:hypothetical protein KC19_5G140200 [Ceratodon purpureus]|uniref:Secreted protein n=1 Tax=Ceratodon purpureus TaxID=3225 RepID=A0A8T0I2P9_CERPU|nr:hypothetical protein KC19_5G140200 [Ceratodon purpureus]
MSLLTIFLFQLLRQIFSVSHDLVPGLWMSVRDSLHFKILTTDEALLSLLLQCALLVDTLVAVENYCVDL